MKIQTRIAALCALLPWAIFTGDVWAGTKLSGAEIRQLLSGRTVVGIAAPDIEFTKTYNADGTFFLNGDGVRKEGTWKITGNLYCQTKQEEEVCFTVEQEGNTYKMFFPNGELHTTFEIQ